MERAVTAQDMSFTDIPSFIILPKSNGRSTTILALVEFFTIAACLPCYFFGLGRSTCSRGLTNLHGCWFMEIDCLDSCSSTSSRSLAFYLRDLLPSPIKAVMLACLAISCTADRPRQQHVSRQAGCAPTRNATLHIDVFSVIVSFKLCRMQFRLPERKRGFGQTTSNSPCVRTCILDMLAHSTIHTITVNKEEREDCKAGLTEMHG